MGHSTQQGICPLISSLAECADWWCVTSDILIPGSSLLSAPLFSDFLFPLFVSMPLQHTVSAFAPAGHGLNPLKVLVKITLASFSFKCYLLCYQWMESHLIQVLTQIQCRNFKGDANSKFTACVFWIFLLTFCFNPTPVSFWTNLVFMFSVKETFPNFVR